MPYTYDQKPLKLDGHMYLDITFDGLYIGNSLVQATSSDRAQVIITNFTPFTQKVTKGCWIGQANEVTVVSPTESFGAQQVEC